MNILLGQLGSNGDCLYATTIARQIKEDFPDCNLTWAISDLCKNTIINNSYVDSVWEIPVGVWENMQPVWNSFQIEAWHELQNGTYEHIYLPQIFPSNFRNYDGTVRPSIFRNYPKKITVPVETIIELTDKEREFVKSFVKCHDLESFDHLVIFECSSKSGQSFMTPALSREIAELVRSRNAGVGFVISTHENMGKDTNGIVSGRELSMRQTAELTHYSSLFVGCGSGLTVVATSDAAKKALPNIQLLKGNTSVYASFKHDYEYFKKPTGHFIESTKENPNEIAELILTTLKDGTKKANELYGEELKLHFNWYFELIDQMLIKKFHFIDAAQSLCCTMDRYGLKKDLVSFSKVMVTPFLQLDNRAKFPHGEAVIERLRKHIGKF